jgi:hypothetical protein
MGARITENIWGRPQDTFDDSQSGYRLQVELVLSDVPVIADGKVSFYPSMRGQISILQRSKKELLPEFALMHVDDCGYLPSVNEIKGIRMRPWQKVSVLQFPEAGIQQLDSATILPALQSRLTKLDRHLSFSEQSMARIGKFLDKNLSEKALRNARALYERNGRKSPADPNAQTAL